ncbi:MAG: ATP-binding protein [Phycisphaerales bacterium]
MVRPGPDAIRGRVVYDAIPGFPPRWHEIHRRGLAGETCRCDLDLYVRPDGGSRWLRWIVTPWHLERGEIGGVITSFEDVERHAFEPYFSRRTDGAGTGIGLGLVKRAVEAADGTIALESTVDIGTTVTMMLPFAV